MNLVIGGKEIHLGHIRFYMYVRIRVPIICIHVRSLPLRREPNIHYFYGERMETSYMLLQVLSQWRGWDLFKWHAMVISYSSVMISSKPHRRFPWSMRSLRASGSLPCLGPRRSWYPTLVRFLRALFGGFSLPLHGGLLSASFEGSHLIIEGLHILVMVSLLITKPGVSPIMCALEGVLHLGLTLLKGSLQGGLYLDLTFS